LQPKPRGLEPCYAAQFQDAAVVAAYISRPPYPDSLVSLMVGLAGGSSGRILDIGCGTGELARRIAPRVRSVTAIDQAERMIAQARKLPGADATNLRWIVGRAEDAPLDEECSLVVAAESFHWFDWDILCSRLAQCRRSPILLVVEDRRELKSPWADELGALIAKFSTNQDFQPYDLIDELLSRSCYAVEGREVLGPESFAQSIDEYIASIHSRNGFSLDRMPVLASRTFDLAVRRAIAPHATDDVLELQIETCVTWGRVVMPRSVPDRSP
jgi:SAM-dependent methyltransferase